MRRDRANSSSGCWRRPPPAKSRNRTAPFPRQPALPDGSTASQGPAPAGAGKRPDAHALRLPGLFARRLSQGVIDAILPAGPALLEVLENVLIDPQRNHFLDARKCNLLRRQFGNLGRRLLER